MILCKQCCEMATKFCTSIELLGLSRNQMRFYDSAGNYHARFARIYWIETGTAALSDAITTVKSASWSAIFQLPWFRSLQPESSECFICTHDKNIFMLRLTSIRKTNSKLKVIHNIFLTTVLVWARMYIYIYQSDPAFERPDGKCAFESRIFCRMKTEVVRVD